MRVMHFYFVILIILRKIGMGRLHLNVRLSLKYISLLKEAIHNKELETPPTILPNDY